MKDVVKLILLVLSTAKDLVNIADDEVSLGKKRRIHKILEDRDLSKLEKIERILFRKGGEKVEIYGYVINGELKTTEKVQMGVVVNAGFLESYYDIASELKKKD